MFRGDFSIGNPRKIAPERGTESAGPKPERSSTFAKISVSHAILN